MDNVLITGTSTGIGLHLAKIYLNHGYRVFGSVRKTEDAKKLKEELGDNFHALIFDVTDHGSVQNAVKELKITIGKEGLACLINNAGIAVSGSVMHTSLADFQKQFDVNLFGVIAVTKACLPLLGAASNSDLKPGKIINISSVSGKIAMPFLSPYCASKFALEAFSDSLRREMLLFGIKVITIAPGPIKTPIWKKSEDVSPELINSDYGKSVAKFQKQMQKSVKHAMEPDELAKRIFNVFKKENPKTRYTFLNRKFTNYTVPMYLLSAKQLDGFIRKMFS
jgi:NAD(P)-dependent dehydrogenase (short-subunit alcohol dehydrogenase family)